MTLTLLFAGNNVAEAELDLDYFSETDLVLVQSQAFCSVPLFIVNQLPFMYIWKHYRSKYEHKNSKSTAMI